MAPSKNSAPQATNEGAEPRSKRPRLLSFTDITTSPTFTILVGTEQREHVIHSPILANQSPVLDALVHNGMQESHARRVDWGQVEQPTFEYFCQFAYTGDFDIKRPSGTNMSSQWLHQHAQIIAFAELYGIDGLLALAAAKLEAALSHLSRPPCAANNVCAIADFSKSLFTTSGPQITRELITSYLAKHGKALWRDPYFKSSVKEVQSLANAFLDCMMAAPNPDTLTDEDSETPNRRGSNVSSRVRPKRRLNYKLTDSEEDS